MTAVILAIAIVLPTAAIVLIARQFFAYRIHRTVADADRLQAYRQLAERGVAAAEAEDLRLAEISARLAAIETLLRSVD